MFGNKNKDKPQAPKTAAAPAPRPAAPAPATAPKATAGKSWRNFYRVYTTLDLGQLRWAPGLHAGPSDFASKDVAEKSAHELLKGVNRGGRTLIEYAGAFPDGERPH